MSSSSESRTLRLAYLAVESTTQGHAAYAHVHEIVDGLRRLELEVDLYEPAERPHASLFGRLLEQVRVQARLWRRWSQYDAIYVRAHYTTLPTALLARITGRPIVQELNGPSDDVFIAHAWTRVMRPLLSWVLRMQLTGADAVVVVTPALGEWVARQTGRRDAEVIPNGANVDLFSPERTTTRVLPENFAIFFGALTAWQGIDTLLAAFEHEQWPRELDLVILGEGAMRDAVAAAAGRHERLHWLGRVPYTEVGPIVARARVGLVPKNGRGGRTETGLFPLKLFEIVACGVPVIVTDFPGQAEFVRAQACGIVVPPEAPEALARAVSTVASSPEAAREMGRRGRAAVESAHSWAHRARETARVVRRVSGATPHPAAHLAG